MNKRQRKKRHLKKLLKIGKTCAVINYGDNEKAYLISRQAIEYWWGGTSPTVEINLEPWPWMTTLPPVKMRPFHETHAEWLQSWKDNPPDPSEVGKYLWIGQPRDTSLLF